MTVRELRALLLALDQDVEVVVSGNRGGFDSVRSVRKAYAIMYGNVENGERFIPNLGEHSFAFDDKTGVAVMYISGDNKQGE